MLSQRMNAALRLIPTWAAYPLGLLPLAFICWDAVTGGLGADPVKTLERHLGELALQFVVFGLAISPLCRILRVNLTRFRRAVGLVTFAYVVLHLTVWVTLDLQMRWATIGAELVKRPYIIVGMVGFLAMVPLAATSNNLSIRKMGTMAWRKLHQLTYVSAIAAAVHYLMLVKATSIEPVLYAVVIGLLLIMRLARHLKTRNEGAI
ncbi:MAG: protein-methionine-sulfoxide reductase heme-binding subunit MsrQ [Paracoccaceae bacterium]|nr:protein-methionine-sulfoxide reductase heme-binding subunit MsrQ [Paracoccaceae bacterium]